MKTPIYITPKNQKCPACKELCEIVPLRNEFNYAGTHCTHGLSGIHYPSNWGEPVSDCCQVLITGEEYED